MARLVLKCPYHKNGKPAGGYVRYIATREGVEKPNDENAVLPAMAVQKKTVEGLLREYPDLIELHEYEDYAASPTRGNAAEFIARAAEVHPGLAGGMGGYVSYIATRPGVQARQGHGLFSDAGKKVVLEQAVREVSSHSGNIWCHIISLRREDAERLGYADADSWRGLLRAQRNTIAAAMKIRPENFRWYAAFHNESHHPHVHMACYSADPHEPWLTKGGIEQMKSALARQVFKNDLMQVYEIQTRHRDALRADAAERIRRIASEIESGAVANQRVTELMAFLSKKLGNVSGKKVYGYLDRDLKSIVDLIVDEIAKDKNIAALYDLWHEQREEVIRTYTNRLPQHLALSQNKEFKTIRNAVVREAVKLSALGPIIEKAGSVDWECAGHQGIENGVRPLPEDAAGCCARLIVYAGNIIGGSALADSMDRAAVQITDGKLWREDAEKKMAQGLRL